jgi:hypothetical protein
MSGRRYRLAALDMNRVRHFAEAPTTALSSGTLPLKFAGPQPAERCVKRAT